MSPEDKRVVISVVRRVVFAGLVLLGVWLVLIALRGVIPAGLIDQMNDMGQMDTVVPHDSSSWDWTTSLRTGEPVSEMVGQQLGATLGFIALNGLLSLTIAVVLLFFGVLISRATIRPYWLAKLRSILRLILVSSGVSIPVFAIGTISIVLMIAGWDQSMQGEPPSMVFWSVFLPSLLPTWLLVQAGHGELSNRPENISTLALIRRMAIRLVIRLLRLVGVIIVITVAMMVTTQPQLGQFLRHNLLMRDFPVIFGIAWVFVVIVTLVKLAAGLIEIAYNYFGEPLPSSEPVEEQTPLRFGVPRGWLIVCLVLVGVSILVAIAGPLLAPYGYNEVILVDRLAGPSAEHILGADNLGRDILSRLLYGTRIDIFAGLTCAGIMAVLATGWAMLAAYFREKNNWLGDTLEELVILPGEIISSFPWLVLLLLVMSMVLPNYDIVMVALISSLVLLPRAAAMIREAYLSLPEGKGWLQYLLRAVPVMLIFTVSGGILYISTATYLGFGVYPPLPELGNMLTGTGRQYMLQAPWMAQWPFICLMFLLMTWIMTGDVLLEKLGFRSKAVWAKAME